MVSSCQDMRRIYNPVSLINDVQNHMLFVCSTLFTSVTGLEILRDSKNDLSNGFLYTIITRGFRIYMENTILEIEVSQPINDCNYKQS